MFRVSARTVLALGAELISSDLIAFYELIKNAFDAKSPDGAEIRFEIVLRRNDYLEFRQRAIDGAVDISRLKVNLCKALNESAPKDSLHRFQEAVDQVRNLESFIRTLDEVYAHENRIIVSDTGTGMSEQDLIDHYLTIGTDSRKRELDAALADHSYQDKRAPFLGEKGIGRLSVMRLGDKLRVETAKKADTYFNILAIDWTKFDTPDTALDKINVTPSRGGPKPEPHWNGTRLIIRGLAADWTKDRVRNELCDDFSRLTDPFSDTKRRPRIAIFWNSKREFIPRMDKHLLDCAHASVKGRYVVRDSGPELKCTVEAIDLGFPHPYVEKDHILAGDDLTGLTRGKSGKVPRSAIRDVGEFQFEIYWFNRKLLKSIDSIGTQKQVRDLQRLWSGILLFRDGFRVLPYGEDGDDWLALDRPALGSKGYLLNRAQFVGRVNISRLGNPKLIDQTNRQGLRVCSEQEVFIALLNHTLQERLRNDLKEIQKRYKAPPQIVAKVKTETLELVDKANVSLKEFGKQAPEFIDTINEFQNIINGFKKLIRQLELRIAEVEYEKNQMIQMAGVGLLVEVVAHELSRSTQNALSALESLRGKDTADQSRGLLGSLRSELRSVSKRLRVLDPLSVSGRQRKERFALDALVQDVFYSHDLQFKRHNIRPTLKMPVHRVYIHGVKGMIVQIIENLISNSIYWLDLRKQRDLTLKPEIAISLETDPLTVTYQDNGSGIAKENREKIFQAFFSLKEKTSRRGLGLYIARECAEYHGGSLTLDEDEDVETGRLHRFILKLPLEVTLS
ncbi:MAG: sensor histidine kinase [Rhodothermaceae bacterium]|nr:sensor histidine kinase [Rhodothermaceae bacterium]